MSVESLFFSANLSLTTGSVAVAASAFGLAMSAHCAGMCGPWACAATPAGTRRFVAAAWHGGRGAAYATVGATLGAVGQGAMSALGIGTGVMPWVMAAGLAASALGGPWLWSRIPRSASARVLGPWMRWASRRAPWTRALLMGAATAFLPCGLLWSVFGAAAGTGSAWRGAVVLAAFAAGSAPALGAAQVAWRTRWLSGNVWLQRGLAAVAAVVLVWRASSWGPLDTSGAVRASSAAPVAAPSCHAPSSAH